MGGKSETLATLYPGRLAQTFLYQREEMLPVLLVNKPMYGF